MIIKNLSLAFIAAVILTSCKETPKQEETNDAVPIENIETTEVTDNNIITDTLVDADGNKLKVVFNTKEETATITISDQTEVLKMERVASGFWYKNENYDLRGKGKEAELKKDGETIFKN